MNTSDEQTAFLKDFLNEGIYIVEEKPEKYEVSTEKEKDEDNPPAESTQTGSYINYLGGNKKNVCILVEYEDEEWIIPKDKKVLTKIIEAIQMSLEDVALINVSNTQEYTVEELQTELSAAKIVSFGIKSSLTSGFEKDKIIKCDGFDILCCNENITSIAMSKEKKTILWKNLKKMFNV